MQNNNNNNNNDDDDDDDDDEFIENLVSLKLGTQIFNKSETYTILTTRKEITGPATFTIQRFCRFVTALGSFSNDNRAVTILRLSHHL